MSLVSQNSPCPNELAILPLNNNNSEKEIASPYAVFQKIKEYASNTKVWDNFLASLSKDITNCIEPAEMLRTSCVINLHAFNMLILGKEQAESIFKFLAFTTSESYSLKLPNKSFYFYHFLSGNALIYANNLNKKSQNPSYKISKEATVPLKDSEEYTVPLNLFKEKIQNLHFLGIIDNNIYNYNHNVINVLESEINENRAKVSEDTSYIYHVAITEPNPIFTYKGSAQQVKDAPIGYFHAFALEHYYSPKENTDLIRLHHSWKEKLSLSEHYEKAGYDDLDQGCMASEDVKRFCDNLRGMLSYDDSKYFSKLKKCQFDCFNVDADIVPPGVFRTEIEIFTGRSIRYLTSQIDPKDCLRNMDDVLNKYGCTKK